MKLVIVVAVWAAFVVAGMAALQIYKTTPGAIAAAPRTWPAASALPRNGRATLVMLSHPRCPCTRASLAELQSLLADYREPLTAYILFIQPRGTGYEWTNTDLWRTASHIDGVHAILDKDAVEADRFQGLTSGQVVLYDADGTLRFSGGITGARGHVGDNLGARRLLAILRGEAADRADSPVFGCPLHAEN